MTAGVLKTEGATPWAATRAEKLQVSMFLPTRQSMDEWFATVHGLPTVCPDLSMIGSGNMRKVIGHDLHDIRIKYQVPSVWGTIYPNWELLQQPS